MKRSSILFFLFLSSIGVAFCQGKFSSRIMLIPLDDRPPCLQFTQKMGLIADAEVVAPPRELLGKFTKAGDPEQLISWIRKQDLKSFDGVIISLDMLAYGGLVASRVYQTPAEQAMKRIAIISEIRKSAPELPIYGQSVLMRLAPTSDGRNEAYREKLARWAAISPYPESGTETAQLEKEIPAEGLTNYKMSRQRDLALNMEAIRLVETGVLNYLILSQDDAKPKGIHVADREKLVARVQAKKLNSKILVQPGTDEISMLLLSRLLNKKYKYSTKVYVRYSSEDAANSAMPFEDRPLRQTVSYNILAAGATETSDPAAAGLFFYVFTSRFEPGKAESFAAEIQKSVKDGKKVMLADVDPKGNVQGGDTTFTKALLQLKLFPGLYSYASWNTAGNTIGTTLPQGLIFDLAKAKLMNIKRPAEAMISAQQWFTFHRVLDDYYFHTIVRPKAALFFNQGSRSGFESPEALARQVEKYSSGLLLQYFNELASDYQDRPDNKIQKLPVFSARNMRFSLPWNRTFEAEIDFDMSLVPGR